MSSKRYGSLPRESGELAFLPSSPIQNSDKFDSRTACINLVQDNFEIIDRHKNWNILLLKEALKIKELNPIMNSGLKASKELLFLFF